MTASSRMTAEKWEPWKERIDGTENNDMGAVWADIMKSDDLQVEEKKAATEYIKNLMKMRGYNLATMTEAQREAYNKKHGIGVNGVNADGEEPQQATVTGARARWNPTDGYVEDPGGRFVQVQMPDGSPAYIVADAPRGIITGYMPAPQEEPQREYHPDRIDQNNPPDDGGTPPPPPAAVGNLKNEEEEPTQPLNSMPMRQVKRKVDGKMTTVEEEDWMATTPARGHQFIYNEAGLSREVAGQFVKANLDSATKALDKAKKEAPKMGTSLVKYKQQQAEHQAKVDAAQQAVDYWQGVKAIQSAIVSAEMAEQAERDRAATTTLCAATSSAPSATTSTTSAVPTGRACCLSPKQKDGNNTADMDTCNPAAGSASGGARLNALMLPLALQFVAEDGVAIVEQVGDTDYVGSCSCMGRPFLVAVGLALFLAGGLHVHHVVLLQVVVG